VQKKFVFKRSQSVACLLILAFGAGQPIQVSSAASKYQMSIKVDSGELKFYTPSKITSSQVAGICKTEFEYPFGERITAVNERGVLLGQGVVNRRLTPKLIRHEKNTPEDEYGVQIDNLLADLENGTITKAEFDAEYAEYSNDKFAAFITCPLQATFSVYPQGNFMRIRIAGFNQMDLMEISRFKKNNWVHTISMDYEQ
jgi:hypothetical protein